MTERESEILKATMGTLDATLASLKRIAKHCTCGYTKAELARLSHRLSHKLTAEGICSECGQATRVNLDDVCSGCFKESSDE